MANPLISQGTLNRLRASVIFPAFPILNVTASFLGEEAIRLGLEGETTTFINTLVGAVTSPEPYMKANITINLNKTQQLANQYKAQMELNALVGDITVRPDTSILLPYQFTNCAIQSIDELRFSGKDAGFAVRIGGYYIVNSAVFDQQ